MRSSSRVITAVIAYLGSSCCDDPNPEPCISWIEMNETYEVEIIELFELDGSASEADDPSPYSKFSRGRQPCGEGFDLSPGDKLTMTAIGEQDRGLLAGGQAACGACMHVDATVSSDRIARLGDYKTGYGIGNPKFADMFEGRVDECRGSYWMGVVPVGEYFLANTERRVATDFMLFREFYKRDTEACRRPGSAISEVAGGCWDSWVVRIRDSSGALKTRDLEVPDSGQR